MVMPLTIEKLYAWISRDEQGQEGIMGALHVDGAHMPLIGADMARIESFRDFVTDRAKRYGKIISLVEFSTRTVLETIGGVEQEVEKDVLSSEGA